MLKKIRTGTSLVIFVLLTCYFLDFAGILPDKLYNLTLIQFIPALLALNIGVMLALTGITLLAGRIYCSSVCPLGIFQDIISHIARHTFQKKKKYGYRKINHLLRWLVVTSVVVLFFLGFSLLVDIIDPYSAYGRITVHLFKPIYLLGNNLLAYIFNSFGNYTFYRTEILMLSVSAFVIGLLTFLLIAFLAWKYGRLYCNTICPVGTVLGFIAKFSFFKVRIDASKCNHCGLCAAKCKSSCINAQEARIDYSRCVDCFNCLDHCHQQAISFDFRRKEQSPERTEATVNTHKRQFLLTGLTGILTLPSLLAQEKTKLASGELREKSLVRQTAISPPGAISTEHLLRHCTSCHLCISKCPSKVLKPAFMEYGVGGMMQPLMYFEKGFCNFDCTVCSSVCPSKALKPLTKEEKHLTQVGKVIFIESLCVVYKEGTNCGACSEHCPTQAVKMLPYKDGLTIPFIDQDICVGCGGCEFICPARPHRAIHVEGNRVQERAKAFTHEQKEETEVTDFGF
ncbi:MAG: 4Fe-4S dicluster domain-containing protein [Bacteroidales bacterium]|jgi:polyferredoxin|nr:4Fe-4S dicluster domain-containing protein [Bacteroidales bacterium]